MSGARKFNKTLQAVVPVDHPAIQDRSDLTSQTGRHPAAPGDATQAE